MVNTFINDFFCYLNGVASEMEQLQEEIRRIAERIDFFRLVLVSTKGKSNQQLIQAKIDALLDEYNSKLTQIKKL